MAAPTSVHVESNSITTARLWFTYSGSAFVEVYRSTDGISYSVVNTSTATSPYLDTGLDTATKYWYKLSDDAGSTFSSVVTVVTHSCHEDAHEQAFALPRFDGQEQQADNLNSMAMRIESVLQETITDPGQCPTCPVDGAIVIDCTDCYEWIVVADTDINSISIKNCNAGKIHFIIPPETTVSIDGWPYGSGFTGNEGQQFPVSGGTDGRTVTASIGGRGKVEEADSKKGYLDNKLEVEKNTGRGGGGCPCNQGVEGQLTLVGCNPNNSMECSTATKSIKLIACGGRRPYTWSKTGTIELDKTEGDVVNVTPPTNSGSAVAGIAYTKILGFWNSTCTICNTFSFGGSCGAQYECDDALSGGDCGIGGASCATPDCSSPAPACADLGTCEDSTCITGDGCTQIKARGEVLDVRTAPMIAAGCNPCGLAADGAIVTVTDAVGVSTSIILRA